MGRLKPATGLWKIQPQWVVTPRKQKTTTANNLAVVMGLHSLTDDIGLIDK
jgi:hypothetical protein